MCVAVFRNEAEMNLGLFPSEQRLYSLPQQAVCALNESFPLLPLSASVWFYKHKQGLASLGAHLMFTAVHFLMHSLAVTHAAIFFVQHTPRFFPPCPPPLAEGTAGSCACRPTPWTSRCGKGGLESTNVYSMFPALNSYFLHTVSSIQLFSSYEYRISEIVDT